MLKDKIYSPDAFVQNGNFACPIVVADSDDNSD